MKAVVLQNDVLVWDRQPAPFCGAEDVILDVHYTAINRADLLQRKGKYAPPPGVTNVLGLEAAGIVAQVGEDVQGWRVGDRAAALLPGGGYAEQCRAHHGSLLPLPEGMPFDVAAAIPEVFFTAYLNLVLEAGMQSGETVLVHAGASGVGTAAIQIAAEMGCRVLATASAPKLEAISELGSFAIDRHAEDFVSCVLDVTDGRGADVILDPVGGAYLAKNQACLAPEGRLVLIGLMGGATANLDLARLMRQRQRIVGSVLRSRSNDEKAAITAHFLHDVWPWIVDERIGPILDSQFDIDDVEAAHAHVASNETIGKVLLRVR